MFNFFHKKENGITVIDRVWTNTEAKTNWLLNEAKTDHALILVFWFEDTLRDFEEKLAEQQVQPSPCLLAREVHGAMLKDKTILFGEHYPLREKELALFESLHLKKVTICSALDEPLFDKLGAGKIISTLKALGIKESEHLEHALISKAIAGAQEKLAGRVTLEQSAKSQAGWMERNLTD